MNETSELSDREIEILKLVAGGLSNKEIAYRLSISPNTVKVHLKNIFAKIGAVSRTEAAMYAVKQGWVTVPLPPTETDSIEEAPPAEVTAAPPQARHSLFSAWWALGAGIFTVIVVLGFWLVGIRGNDQPQVVQVVVTSTPEPVRWEWVTDMPETKKSMAYVAVNSKIYLIGGETPNGVSARLDVYDTVSGKWSAGARKPTPVSQACAVYLGGKIIVAGGKTTDGTVTDAVEAYDIEADRWESLPSLPSPLAGTTCTEYQGFYYLLGGLDGKEVRGEVWKFSPLEGKWTLAGNLQQALAYSSLTKIREEMYLIGGWDGEKATDRITRLSFGRSLSESLASLQLDEGRYRLASVGVLEKIYVIGGVNGTTTLNNSLELDWIENAKRLMENPAGKEWHSHGAALVGEYVYGFGGVQGEDVKGVYRIRVLYTIILPLTNN